jgi:hypothetical protein
VRSPAGFEADHSKEYPESSGIESKVLIKSRRCFLPVSCFGAGYIISTKQNSSNEKKGG